MLAIYFSVCYITIVRKNNGGLAQLGEHLPYKQAVIGSSPIVPTIFYSHCTNGACVSNFIFAGMAQW